MGADDAGFVTARRATSNVAALERALRRLRRDRRLDEVAEVLAALAATSTALVDLVTSTDELNDTAPYARAACVRAHAGVLDQLAGRVTPANDSDDPWERIARELAVPGYMGDAPEG